MDADRWRSRVTLCACPADQTSDQAALYMHNQPVARGGKIRRASDSEHSYAFTHAPIVSGRAASCSCAMAPGGLGEW